MAARRCTGDGLPGLSKCSTIWCSQGLNRVLLLSDGLANVGLTDSGAICAEVRGMASQEVSTSTIGVGSDYNEELLGAMARAGAGNYYYVENSVQLRDIFQTELQGLMGTTGRNVELKIQPGQGVAVTEVLTQLDRGPAGQIKLPDLVSEMPISVMIRLSIAAPVRKTPNSAAFHLAWDPTGETASGRHETEVSLALRGVPVAEWEKLPIDPAVQEQLVLLMATRGARRVARGSPEGRRPHRSDHHRSDPGDDRSRSRDGRNPGRTGEPGRHAGVSRAWTVWFVKEDGALHGGGEEARPTAPLLPNRVKRRVRPGLALRPAYGAISLLRLAAIFWSNRSISR